MHSPILPLVHAITTDRIREAEAARLARDVAPEPPQLQRRRRIRALATRLAFSAK
jgi:hypothetical protein